MPCITPYGGDMPTSDMATCSLRKPILVLILGPGQATRSRPPYPQVHDAAEALSCFNGLSRPPSPFLAVTASTSSLHDHAFFRVGSPYPGPPAVPAGYGDRVWWHGRGHHAIPQAPPWQGCHSLPSTFGHGVTPLNRCGMPVYLPI